MLLRSEEYCVLPEDRGVATLARSEVLQEQGPHETRKDEEAVAGRTRLEDAATARLWAASWAGTITCCTVDLTSGYLLPPNGLDAAARAVHSRVRGHHRLLTGCLRCAGNTGTTAPEGRFPKDD